MKFIKTTLFLCLPFMAAAQLEQGTFVYGPKAGFNLTRVQIPENPAATQARFRIDFNAGVYARVNLGKFSIQPEVLYQGKGGNIRNPTQQLNYRYISTPVVAGFTPVRGVTLEGGIEYDWALNSGAANTIRNIYGPDAKTDMAYIGGVRFDMLDALSRLSVTLRYVHGTMDQTNRTFTNLPVSYYNRTIQLSASYNLADFYKWWRRGYERDNLKRKKK